jgi:hypothetical protein
MGGGDKEWPRLGPTGASGIQWVSPPLRSGPAPGQGCYLSCVAVCVAALYRSLYAIRRATNSSLRRAISFSCSQLASACENRSSRA